MLEIIKNTVDETLGNQKNVTNVTDNVTNNLQESILELIKENNKISLAEIGKNVNKSKRTIQRNINSLKENGVIKRIGDNKTGYWKIL